MITKKKKMANDKKSKWEQNQNPYFNKSGLSERPTI